jgi:CTP:molybdopterin cytidylyltransferase MocA
LIAAVVLAAGAATRFGAPKQRLLLGDVLARLAESLVDEVVVVAGAHPLELPAEIPLRDRSRVVDCPDWERGPGASLRCGLAALSPAIEAAVVVLADGPDLAPEAVSRVIESWREDGGDVVAASYDGARGHPLLLDRTMWNDVPDEGFRVREPRLVPCDDLGAPGDVDAPEDLPERFR